MDIVIRGRVVEVENDNYINVIVDSVDKSGLYKIGVHKDNLAKIPVESLRAGDTVAFWCAMTGKKSDRGFYGISLWAKTLESKSPEQRFNDDLSRKYEKSKGDDAPWK